MGANRSKRKPDFTDDHGNGLFMGTFFSDCSWSNDEVPSYYIDGVEDLHLMACDEIDDNGDRISDEITYLLLFNSRPCADEYLSIDDAIAAYIELAATIDSQ